MLKLTLLASLLSIASLQTVSARQAPPLLAKRGVIGVDVNFCPHWDKLEACRGGSHACCRQFCASYRVSIETEAATQFCNPGNAPKKPDPSPPPPPPPPPPAPSPPPPPPPTVQVAPAPIVIGTAPPPPPPTVYYAQPAPQVLYSQPVPYAPAPVLVQSH
ncbi:hypothetical protein PGT21_021792 [Puccinia graminis f. sp. tritici]|uniref:Uncharacterized protein n=1 Tax=Puccinia graminis f. sp. tritici TaxID=56615 RepID=A0A5B0N2Z3_PUCGR|nr:hypothetical protein PGT21_021792 [Puccinia graminis f. sp. tritici]